ncbi:hypothetical protein PMAYCL1PPCAC_06726, partial [Pristionchus mayeri]
MRYSETTLFYTVDRRAMKGTLNIDCILIAGVDDLDEVWFEGGSSHEESIDVSLLPQFDAVVRSDRSSVDDPRRLSHLLAHFLAQELPHPLVHLLCLFGRGSLASSN